MELTFFQNMGLEKPTGYIYVNVYEEKSHKSDQHRMTQTHACVDPVGENSVTRRLFREAMNKLRQNNLTWTQFAT